MKTIRLVLLWCSAEAALLMGCQTAHMPITVELAPAERLSIQGRQGWKIEEHLRLGPFGIPCLCVLLGTGCTSALPPEPPGQPRVFVSSTGDTLRFGHSVPGWTPGTRILEYKGLKLPDGATQVFVEATEDGEAHLFEFLYPPEQPYEAVITYYEETLGPATRHYERVAGQCVVWKEPGCRFEVCKAREPAGDGEGMVIAHLLPDSSP